MPKLPNSETCFVCGDDNPAGLSVRFHTDGEKVWTEFTPEPAYAGYHGTTHGGIVAALLDETMGWAPVLRQKRFCVSVQLNVKYRRPVPVGEPITVVGWTVDAGRRIWQTAGEVRAQDGTVLAQAEGRYMPVSAEETARVCGYLRFDEGCVEPEDIRGS